MTKISCTECRGRLGEVLAAEVAPLRADAQVAASPNLALLRAGLSDLTLLQAHLKECSDCARDLALMRATRAVMQSLAAPPLPTDLRELIRAAIEQEATVEAATVPTAAMQEADAPMQKESTPIAANTAPSPSAVAAPRIPKQRENSENSELQNFWESCASFFRRPSNVAWASGLALAAFCVMLVARPERRNDALSPTLETSPAHAPLALEKAKPTAEPTKAAAAPRPQPTPPAKPGAPSSTPLPGLPPFSGGAPLPFWGDDPFASPLPQSPTESKKLPFVSPAPASKAPQGKTARDRAPLGVPRASVAPSGASSVLSTPPSSATGAISDAKRDESAQMLTEPLGSKRALPAPVPRLAQIPEIASEHASEQTAGALRASRVASGGFAARAEKPADAEVFNAPKASAPPMSQRDASPPVRRFVSEKIKAPQDIGWGQVCVTLQGDARFDDGTKVRVVWRGAVSSGETVNVGFTVVAPRGEYSARLNLQTLQQGDAQNVLTTSVPLTLR